MATTQTRMVLFVNLWECLIEIILITVRPAHRVFLECVRGENAVIINIHTLTHCSVLLVVDVMEPVVLCFSHLDSPARMAWSLELWVC